MDFLNNFAEFFDSFLRAFFTSLGANGRNSMFSFLSSAIISCLLVRVLFKRGK